MNFLVVGSGAREHALAWKLAQSPAVERIFCVPGSAAISERVRTSKGLPVECAALDPLDFPGLASLCKDRGVGWVVVGPEAPLSEGLADALRGRGIQVFGPGKKEAMLEASKAFAKGFMRRHRIPTARYRIFEDPALARDALRKLVFPLVIKADGLAQGKGVRVCAERAEAEGAVHDLMEKRVHGPAGARILIEERLEGEEATLMAFSDGKRLLPLPLSRDHKRLEAEDRGPNTGGMGAFAPVALDFETAERVDRVLETVREGLLAEGMDYRGLLYIGLMLTAEGPKVLEFNVRFGDPEAQTVLPLLKTDFAELVRVCCEGRLEARAPETFPATSVCMVLASEGYPGPSSTGRVIHGLEGPPPEGVQVFHAGTRKEPDGRWVTAGGRVLSVVALGSSLEEARQTALRAASQIHFEGMQLRSDIGLPRALKAHA